MFDSYRHTFIPGRAAGVFGLTMGSCCSLYFPFVHGGDLIIQIIMFDTYLQMRCHYLNNFLSVGTDRESDVVIGCGDVCDGMF